MFEEIIKKIKAEIEIAEKDVEVSTSTNDNSFYCGRSCGLGDAIGIIEQFEKGEIKIEKN